VKFRQLLIRTTSIKIVATRRQILRLKCTKIAPDSTGELTVHPKPLCWNKGDLLIREREGCREGKGRRNRGRQQEERGGRRGHSRVYPLIP